MKRGLSTGDIATAALYDCDDVGDHGVHTQTRAQRKRSKKRDVNTNATKTQQPVAVTAASEAAMPQQIFHSTTTPASAVLGNGRSDTADDHSEVHESMLVSDLKKELVQLRGTVHQLQVKVELLLSVVGIESRVTSSSITSTSLAAAPQSGSDANVDTSLASTANQSVEYEKTGNLLSDNDFPVLGHPPVTSQSAMNYVGAARQTTLCSKKVTPKFKSL